MKILITGSNGFIGKNIKEHFQTKFNEIFAPKRDELNLLNRNAVESYIKKNNFDVIIHCCVTLTSIEENLEMYFNIERLSDLFGKLICIGSGAEFDGKNYLPKMSEDYFNKYIPLKSDIYGYSKYEIAKDILKKKRNIYNLRVFGIFGKYEDYLYKFISNTIIKQLLSVPIILNQNARYHYLHIEDLCRIIEELIKVRPVDKIINVTPKDKIELVNIIKIIQKLIPNNNSVKIIKKGFGKEYTVSNEELLKFYNSFTTPEKSILELIKFYKNKLSVIKKSLYKIKKDNFLKYAKTINR